MMRRSNSGILVGLIAAFLWATAFVGPSAVQPASQLLLVTGRYIVFGLCGLFILYREWTDVRKIPFRIMIFAWHLGVIGYLVFYIAIAYAVETGGGFVTAVIFGSSPISVAVIGNILERRTRWATFIPPVVMIFLGIFYISTAEFDAGVTSSTFENTLLSVALALLGSAAISYFYIVNAYVHRIWTDVPVAEHWTGMVAVGAGSGSLILLPLAFFITPPETFSPPVLANLTLWAVWLGYFSSWYGTLIWVRASAGIPATLAGPILATEPVFGAVLSLIWEWRLPTLSETVGSSLIILGVSIILLVDSKRLSPRCGAPAR